jgi:hypothetical protein
VLAASPEISAKRTRVLATVFTGDLLTVCKHSFSTYSHNKPVWISNWRLRC